jgi:two-component system, OmpR family, phosphate regulon response regulator OmpR
LTSYVIANGASLHYASTVVVVLVVAGAAVTATFVPTNVKTGCTAARPINLPNKYAQNHLTFAGSAKNTMQSTGSESNNMSKPAKNLFVVEDDVAIRDMVSAYLEKQGYVVTAMASAEDMLRRLNRLRPDLIVLDITLPALSGLQACQQLRAEGDHVPIILLTARSEEVDRVIGLEMGADDYLGKPFSARELLARIEAVLRRSRLTPGIPEESDRIVNVGACTFQPSSRSLNLNGELRVLTNLEYSLLRELVNNPKVPISRERLLAVTHRPGFSVLSRTVDVSVMRLRKIIEPAPSQPRFIQTVRGHGYMFVP